MNMQQSARNRGKPHIYYNSERGFWYCYFSSDVMNWDYCKEAMYFVSDRNV